MSQDREHASRLMDNPSSVLTLVPLIIVAFVLMFALIWALVITLISLLSGWQRLAQHYRATIPSIGQPWYGQSGTVGWSRYRGVLTLTPNSEGLFLEVLWLFALGHPRLFIPWREFREAKIERYFFQRVVKAEIGFPTRATVRLPAAVFEESAGRKVLVNPPVKVA